MHFFQQYDLQDLKPNNHSKKNHSINIAGLNGLACLAFPLGS